MTTLPKLRFRAMEPEDLDVLYAIENDRALWDLGATNVPYSRYVLHDYIANTKNDIYADGQVRMIIENEGGEVVGLIDMMNHDAKNNKAELGIVVMNRYRRQGYASAAISQMLVYAKSVLHLHQLYAVVAVSNPASSRLFLHSGFSEAARLRDWLFDGEKYADALLLQTFL